MLLYCLIIVSEQVSKWFHSSDGWPVWFLRTIFFFYCGQQCSRTLAGLKHFLFGLLVEVLESVYLQLSPHCFYLLLFGEPIMKLTSELLLVSAKTWTDRKTELIPFDVLFRGFIYSISLKPLSLTFQTWCLLSQGSSFYSFSFVFFKSWTFLLLFSLLLLQNYLIFDIFSKNPFNLFSNFLHNSEVAFLDF